MLHLPALEETGAISRVLAGIAKIGLTLRGAYGEGSEPSGSIYQLSNQISLGISEEYAVKNLAEITAQIIEKEKSARKKLVSTISFQDKIFRSLGILSYAKKLSYEEFSSHISNLKIGISEGLLKGISINDLNKLIFELQAASLSCREGEELSPEKRDILRAKQVNLACAGITG
jgi:protein arginine kinase